MNLANDVIITCGSCDNIIRLGKNQFECETETYERSMGGEIQYEFYTNVDCPGCSNEISINISGWEYPVGAFNYEEADISGGRYLQAPELAVGLMYSIDEETIEDELPKVNQIILEIKNNPQYVYDITSREFEEVVAEIFRSKGYEVKLTPATRDGGKDLIVKYNVMGKPFVIYVECKKYGSENKVSVDVIRGLYGVQTSEKVNAGLIVTTSAFTTDAVDFAKKQGYLMNLADFNELIKWINAY
ncbi:Restriction endonuclease [Paenibacillus sp. OK060]|uniref:restriction endonuclease n=1 Tax=Paenibacillus sp. OK060 TaxID=1881034 RepID=UPI00088EB62E|nr:restriction endonuclease [Paenibacillus sp. OK060]SDM42853.1 Restriction endonuclease [Paenibacillus sp. OK060]